jgi:hypothetical protein
MGKWGKNAVLGDKWLMMHQNTNGLKNGRFFYA